MATIKYNRKTSQGSLVWRLRKLVGAYKQTTAGIFGLISLLNNAKWIINKEESVEDICPNVLLPTLTSPLIGQQLVAFLATALEAAHCISTHMIASPVVEAALVNIYQQKNQSTENVKKITNENASRSIGGGTLSSIYMIHMRSSEK